MITPYMQYYFERDYATVGYDEDTNVILIKWLTNPTSEELREGSNTVITAMKRFGSGNVIWDSRFLQTISPEDQQWAATEYYNNAIEAGYSRAAFILPEDIFALIAEEDIISQLNSFPIGYFNAIETAMEWIQQIPSVL